MNHGSCCNMKVEVYTDGSGMTKATPGGYGYVVVSNGCKVYEGSGHMDLATNNDAEMQAAIEGLGSLKEYFENNDMSTDDINLMTDIYLVSDSQIILGWASGRYEFKQEDKFDKYELLQQLVKTYHVKTRWVRGHDGNEHNERCDKLANLARLEEPK